MYNERSKLIPDRIEEPSFAQGMKIRIRNMIISIQDKSKAFLKQNNVRIQI